MLHQSACKHAQPSADWLRLSVTWLGQAVSKAAAAACWQHCCADILGSDLLIGCSQRPHVPKHCAARWASSLMPGLPNKLPIDVGFCAQGDIKSELVDFAEEHAVDLLVVAASSNVGLKKAFGTSTSTHLTHHAPCPTLVVPTRIANPGAELHTTSENFDRGEG